MLVMQRPKVEELTDIVLNLKDLVFHSESDEPIEIRVDVVGPQQVTGESFATNSEVDVINPDLHIATVNSKANLSFEVTVEKGVGYLSSDRTIGDGVIGVIPVDALFSPVRRVSFEVGNTRVDQSTDYDELILKIETDGSLTPREALASSGKTLGSLVGLVESLAEEEVQGLELTEAESPETNSPDIDLQIEELELSERPRNCLKRAQVLQSVHQKSMMANLVASLIAAEAITTTEAKAKALRPIAEKMITKAKKGGLHNHRQVVSFLRDREMASKLFDDIGPRYQDRSGGYTRVIKIGPRHGDNAPMARIELV